MRIVLAGLLDAILMFVWTSIAHMATPLGSIGFSKISNEQPVLDVLKQNVGAKAGLYFFPWVDPNDPKMMDKSAALMKTNPSGLMIYQPAGARFSMGPMLLKEFAKEFLQCLLAAYLLSLTALTAYAGRVGFIAVVGVFAALGSDTSYWIWYGFPLSYTLAVIAMPLIGIILAALGMALVVKPSRPD
ncbi:MAG: hypothetical protein P4L57_05520 [Rhizomicrobium sp.]|nr:hypothetical protein [Rhizomicrobium sp.]